MIVGVCTFELFLPGKGSLKEKRRVLSSLKERLKNRFNLSVAEIDDQDLWQKAVIGMACVGNEKKHVQQVLDKAMNLVHGVPLIEVTDFRIEFV